MRNEALIHFHYGHHISAGIHLAHDGDMAASLISQAAPFLSPREPGKCVAGFCALHASQVADITNAPPEGWHHWRPLEWDTWFGRIHGVYLVDLQELRVTQYPLYRCSAHIVACDFSRFPGRLRRVEEWIPA